MKDKPQYIAEWIQKETNCEKELQNQIELRIARMIIDRDIENDVYRHKLNDIKNKS